MAFNVTALPLEPTAFWQTVRPVLLYIIAIAIYGIFVFKFYRFLARRDIFDFNLKKYTEGFSGLLSNLARIVAYILENLFLMPVLIFFWFAVLATLLLFLSRNHTPDTLLLIAISLVGAVRIAAYYNENLSQDLAKMIPFALLGVFLVDFTYFSFDRVIETAWQLPSFWAHALSYLVLMVMIELVLRVFTLVFRLKSVPADGRKEK